MRPPRFLVLGAAVLAAVAVLDAQAPARRVPQPSARPTAPAVPAAEARPRTERAVPYAPGETLTYDVSWSGFVTAGSATVAVREKRPAHGSTAYHMVAEGQPTPLLARLYAVYYKAETLVDVYSLLPHWGSLFSDEGGRRRLQVTTFDQTARTATVDVRTATQVTRRVRLPGATQDPLSVVYAARGMPLALGSTVSFPVAERDEVLHVELTVTARETVRTGLGLREGWKVVPVISDALGRTDHRKLTLWISEDPRRLPLKMQAELPVGSFDLTLRAAQP
jgi:hypothetical protein